MQGFLRQSTLATVTVGPLVDKADGVTAKVAFTGTVRLRKGGVWAARASAVAPAHAENGYFDVQLNETDTNTVGAIRLAAQDAASYFPVFEDFCVLPGAVYDALVAGTAKFQVTHADGDLTNLAARVWAIDELEVDDGVREIGARSPLQMVRWFVNGFSQGGGGILNIYKANGSTAYSMAAQSDLTVGPIIELVRA